MLCEALVRRFHERLVREATEARRQGLPIRARPPVSAEAMAEAEARLGFPLPPPLRALYTRVGDGGYGPGAGLYPLIEGPWSLVAVAEATASADGASWPPKLVDFVGWGCLYASCVDCSGPPYPVWFYDCDRSGDAGPSEFLYPEADSLEGWLSAWLDGVDLWAVGPKARRAAQGA